MKLPGCSEEQVQGAVCQHLRLRPAPGLVWWHTPNGGARSRAEAGRFKMLGVQAGIPDLMAVRAGRVFALELKATGGRVSVHQREMLKQLSDAGAETAVAFGVDEALAVLEGWGLLRQAARAQINGDSRD